MKDLDIIFGGEDFIYGRDEVEETKEEEIPEEEDEELKEEE